MPDALTISEINELTLIPWDPFGFELKEGGGLNCWGITRHVMRMKGLDIPEMPCEGFVRVEDPEPLDVVAMSLTNPRFVTHCGVMVSETEFLHSTRGRGVCMGRINRGFLKACIRGFYRWMA